MNTNMNYVNALSAVLLFLGLSQVKSQSTDFKTLDKPVKCTNIKNGTFLRENYPEGIWHMTIKDNIQTEYFNNGKDFVKSSLVFLDDCTYKAIVVEKSDPSDPAKVGDVIDSKVIETSQNFLKIQSKYEKEKFELVLIKIK